jgi:hypothetical protein
MQDCIIIWIMQSFIFRLDMGRDTKLLLFFFCVFYKYKISYKQNMYLNTVINKTHF